ncbi:3-isopropylmalate dehydratase large subunit [Parasphingopyxis algicola]|nr:3-isopropylmalate dehydratase large subunit [Parasphingopyxis algicola]
MPRTLYDRLWDGHVVKRYPSGKELIYIDRHLVQEVSSPQAFAGLDGRGVDVRRPGAQLAVADHAVSTDPDRLPRPGSLAAKQLQRLTENCSRHGIRYIPMDSGDHGIVHIIGPELGFTLPGTTLVCGDSHTSTHGAFGALAFGIGTSECETVFAVQSLRQQKQRRMRVRLTGKFGRGVSVKDAILALIARIGTGGARGFAVEFAGPAVLAMSMEERMTLCNMSIEAGARIGLVAPDDTTFAYLEGRPYAPGGVLWDRAVASWRALRTDEGAVFDHEVSFDLSDLAPQVTWGTTPAECAAVTGQVPDAVGGQDYMGLKPGDRIQGIAIDRVFIGSCTNGRIEDLRRSANVLRGRKVAEGVNAMVVPGSARVREMAEAQGLDRIFRSAGFEWRNAGCSMCVAMNDDRLEVGERCASTSNRNFEGRQGRGGRTHLMSPEMAAAAAVTGKITDVRRLLEGVDG